MLRSFICPTDKGPAQRAGPFFKKKDSPIPNVRSVTSPFSLFLGIFMSEAAIVLVPVFLAEVTVPPPDPTGWRPRESALEFFVNKH
jgi:hypothetical protein